MDPTEGISSADGSDDAREWIPAEFEQMWRRSPFRRGTGEEPAPTRTAEPPRLGPADPPTTHDRPRRRFEPGSSAPRSSEPESITRKRFEPTKPPEPAPDPPPQGIAEELMERISAVEQRVSKASRAIDRSASEVLTTIERDEKTGPGTEG